MGSLALFLLALVQASAQSNPEGVADPAAPSPALNVADKRERVKQKLEAEFEPGFLALFEQKTYEYTGGGYRHRVFKYRLFVPEGAGPGNKLPLVVWLHGRGEAGEENVRHLMHLSQLVFPPPRERKRYPFFLLAVQCPRDNPVWTTSSPAADDMLNVAVEILEQTVANYPIDDQRISLSGVSSGGGACWELALRKPGYFSAVAPLASGGAGTSGLEGLQDVPLWAFHSSRDYGTPVHGVRATVAALQAVGAPAYLTEVESQRHDCWHAAFADYELLDWLLAQKRGQKSQPPRLRLARGRAAAAWQRLTTGWTPLLVLGQVGIPVLLLVAIWSARRRRVKTKAPSH